MQIFARDVHSHSEDFPPFISFDLDAAGSFNKTFRASPSGEYMVSMPGKNEHLVIKDNATHDFGLVESEHPFVCEVMLRYISGDDVTIAFDHGPLFPASTNTVFYQKLNLTRKNYEANHLYYLDYSINPKNDASQPYHLEIPITQGDTVRAQVAF